MKKNIIKEKQIVCFLHIEKAAGTTVHEILRSNYWNYFWESPYIYDSNDESQSFYLKSDELLSIGKRIPNFKAFGGHSIRLWEDYGRLFEQGVFYFTFFRDPIKRYLSNYFFQKNNMEIERTFEDYLSDRYFSNFMTKKICGKPDHKKAIKIINQYNVFIGFVEAFDFSLALLRKELSAVKEDFNIKYEKQNVNKNKYSNMIDELLKTYKDEIYKNNEADCELYNYFYQRFQQQQQLQHSQFNSYQLAEIQKKNMDYRFNRVRKKFQHKLKRLYFQKLEGFYRDQSMRKLLI